MEYIVIGLVKGYSPILRIKRYVNGVVSRKILNSGLINKPHQPHARACKTSSRGNIKTMRKLFDEDGNEVEVLDDKELEDLKTKAKDAGEFAKLSKKYNSLRKELDVKKGESLMDAIKLAKESTNPNFKKLRAKIARYETHIKSLDKDAEFDEEGNVTNRKEKISMEDIEKKQKATTLKTLVEVERKKLLSKYPEDKRKVIEKNLDKLMTGEEENIENINKFFSQATKLSSVEQPKATKEFGGSEPVLDADGNKFINSEKATKAANEIFGDESFANKDNK